MAFNLTDSADSIVKKLERERSDVVRLLLKKGREIEREYAKEFEVFLNASMLTEKQRAEFKQEFYGRSLTDVQWLLQVVSQFPKSDEAKLRAEFRSNPALRKIVRCNSDDPTSAEWKRKEDAYVKANAKK